ncbi:MAG: ATP-binding cassette domain-containing protein, partial [Myxococcota bacterium]
CGKSSLVCLATALYHPEAGEIRVDDTLVDRTNIKGYRELFSAIFASFHLFDRLYGMPQVPRPVVRRLLEKMNLESKTDFVDGRFTNLELSTGQRKRLAMIVALLEDKPIYVFDEWAAEQDPQFKEYFYDELLPELKQNGKTIIVVSHDDRYFHIADTLIKMEFGRIVETTKPAKPS